MKVSATIAEILRREGVDVILGDPRVARALSRCHARLAA
jgi:hypothetical protein